MYMILSDGMLLCCHLNGGWTDVFCLNVFVVVSVFCLFFCKRIWKVWFDIPDHQLCLSEGWNFLDRHHLVSVVVFIVTLTMRTTWYCLDWWIQLRARSDSLVGRIWPLGHQLMTAVIDSNSIIVTVYFTSFLIFCLLCNIVWTLLHSCTRTYAVVVHTVILTTLSVYLYMTCWMGGLSALMLN